MTRPACMDKICSALCSYKSILSPHCCCICNLLAFKHSCKGNFSMSAETNRALSHCRPLVLADGEAMSLDFGYSSVRRVFSSLKITNRSFRYASPHLWNQLPVSFRQPCTKHSAEMRQEVDSRDEVMHSEMSDW